MFLPLVAQGLLGLNPTAAGMLLMPFTLGMVSGSTLSGQLSTRWHTTHPLAIGGLALASLGSLTLLAVTWFTSNLWWMAGAVALVGLGLGATFPIFLLMAQNAVPPSQLGSATALVQFFRSVGGTIGVAALGALLAAQFESQLQSHPLATGASLPSAREFLSPGGLAGLAPAMATAVQDSLRSALAGVFMLSALSAAWAWWISRSLDRVRPSADEGFQELDSA